MNKYILSILKRAGEVNEPLPETHASAPEFKLRPRAEVILYNKDGIYGIMKKEEGYIVLPGGGIAHGERPVEAAIRETMEEADRICHNIEDKGVMSSMYDQGTYKFKDWDGETTHFFMALDGGPSEMNHKDKENFKVIPFSDALIYMGELLDRDDQLWAFEINLKRASIISDAANKARDESGTVPIKYAMRMWDKVASYSWFKAREK